MQEKELRLAIVCSGGVSLAVYMHGLTKELLKLVRASKLYHAVPDFKEKQRRDFAAIRDVPGQKFDTEEVYFDLLQQIGKHIDLRVVIDIISGSSAGGINGVMLARALAHDLPFESLRSLWLDGADVRELVSQEQNDRWSDRLLRPLVKLIAKDHFHGLADDDEAASKLLSMLQIARLQSPFDGERLLAMTLEALEDMGTPRHASDSLMPLGHELELFVTLTDFFGYTQRIPLYDPPVIEEQEHRHILSFHYHRWTSGDEESDFLAAGLPALAFACRASASFPGLFPAARLFEVDNVLKKRGTTWLAKAEFLENNFKAYKRVGADPEATAFIDGAVLNNKPFDSAIDAILGRPAYRRVDRRLIYINPNPAGRPEAPTASDAPGLLRTLKASLSDIPRNEPIADDLSRIREFNRHVVQTKAIIEASRADIEAEVVNITKGRETKRHLSEQQISRWRDQANSTAGASAGLAYRGYIRLKLESALSTVSRLIGDLCDVEADSPEAAFITRAMQSWAETIEAFPIDLNPADPGPRGRRKPPWLRLLRDFDMEFRERRIRFVIQSLNQLYTRLNTPEFTDLNAYRLDYLKGSFYEVLDALRKRQGTHSISLEAASRVQRLFGPVLASASIDPEEGVEFAQKYRTEITTLMESLARDLALETMNYQADDVLASMESTGPGGLVRARLLTDYLGFAWWDILTFSTGSWRNQGEFDEIHVSRISPQDCTALSDEGPKLLKGVEMGNFGAFFKREHRENDYLWGRLHGVDRLIDIIVDAISSDDPDHDGNYTDIDTLALKKRAFGIILESEKEHLVNSADLLDKLGKQVETLNVTVS